MIAFKLFRKLPDGKISSLFLCRKNRLPLNVWLNAQEDLKEETRKAGLAFRPGWHCTAKPVAPHLKEVLKNGERRVWFKVEIEDFEEIPRPESQGGLWYLAKKIKILEEIC